MKLSELFKEVEIKVPDTDLVIKIKPELSWFEQIEYSNIKEETEKSKYLVLRLITKWNLLGDDGKLLPITKEIIEKLPVKVIGPIIEKLAETIKQQGVKKKS